MFEQALVVRTGDKPDQADVCLLAETLFFYGSVHLLLNAGALVAHVTKFPEGDFLRLLDRKEVKFSYLRPAFAVMTNGPPPLHDFGAMTLHAEGIGKKPLNFREDMEVRLERALGSSTNETVYPEDS
ncbi:hypothetical protein ACNJYA_04815 [Bradyrhizobium sp. DASA03068]|uniref:hypothetical protein n=1 Tax=Bradyrhizobium sp. BLXBL-01 TaxID=3395915 RepID=UPI003F72D675